MNSCTEKLILEILKDLVSFKSISPKDDGAIDYLDKFLCELGFCCNILEFNGVRNLYAKFGNFAKNICFAGHIDVVPPLSDSWESDPFCLSIRNRLAYARGTNDMKGPLSACLACVREFISNDKNPNFSISFLITSDEEIMGDYGTKSVVEFLKKNGEEISCCILCESCSKEKSGEYIKIGCRGSLNVDLTSNGTQCHVATAPYIGNHMHDLVKFLSVFCVNKIDDGNEIFPPSSVQLTSLNALNDTRNIVPEKSTALLNIRFNNIWNFESLESYILTEIKKYSSNIKVSFERFGEAFIGASDNFINFLRTSIIESIGVTPEVGVLGGNSDALFLKNITEVVEIGSPIANAHITNEFISIDDLNKLFTIYKHILMSFGNKNF